MKPRLLCLLTIIATFPLAGAPKPEELIIKTDGAQTFIGKLEFKNRGTTVVEFNKIFGTGRPVFQSKSIRYFYDDYGFQLKVVQPGIVEEMIVTMAPPSPDPKVEEPKTPFRGKFNYRGIEFDHETSPRDLLNQFIEKNYANTDPASGNFPMSLPAGSNGWWFFPGRGFDFQKRKPLDSPRVFPVTLMSHPKSPPRDDEDLVRQFKRSNSENLKAVMKLGKAKFPNTLDEVFLDYRMNDRRFESLSSFQKICFLMNRFNSAVALDGPEFFYGQHKDINSKKITKMFEEIGATQHAAIYSKISALYGDGPTGDLQKSVEHLAGLPPNQKKQLARHLEEYRQLPTWEPLFMEWDYQRQSKK